VRTPGFRRIAERPAAEPATGMWSVRRSPRSGSKGGLAMESFINMSAELAYGLSVWRPVAKAEAMENGLPFLRNKAKQYK
jgi:hypothetical protein